MHSLSVSLKEENNLLTKEGKYVSYMYMGILSVKRTSPFLFLSPFSIRDNFKTAKS